MSSSKPTPPLIDKNENRYQLWTIQPYSILHPCWSVIIPHIYPIRYLICSSSDMLPNVWTSWISNGSFKGMYYDMFKILLIMVLYYIILLLYVSPHVLTRSGSVISIWIQNLFPYVGFRTLFFSFHWN